MAMFWASARMEWLVRERDRTRREWPPETRRERKGKAGVKTCSGV